LHLNNHENILFFCSNVQIYFCLFYSSFKKYFQKKDPLYKEIKEDTTWSMEQFNQYINKYVAPLKNLPQDWVFNDLTVNTKNRERKKF
jgi:hypothetical protein